MGKCTCFAPDKDKPCDCQPAHEDEVRVDTLVMADAWLHIMDNTDGIPENEPWKKVTFSPENPFGMPGKNYSSEYKVESIPLYRKA